MPMTDPNHLANEVARQRRVAIERLMIETIERHLGRVPTCEEVSAKGKRVFFTNQNEEHYLWDGFLLFSITNHTKGFGFEVAKFV